LSSYQDVYQERERTTSFRFQTAGTAEFRLTGPVAGDIQQLEIVSSRIDDRGEIRVLVERFEADSLKRERA
jgi:hypothetical protein